MNFILSTALLLLLVMDPLGNLPFFISTLKHVPPERYYKIIIREALIALLVLAMFLVFGKNILEALQVSQGSLGIAGGIVLLLIAVKMIFGSPNETDMRHDGEPLIVPLAVPMIAGPSAVATIILIRGHADSNILESFAALLIAWTLCATILLFSRLLGRLLGNKVLDAGESLMGLLLAALAVEMLIKGIRNSFFPG
ncbi:MAG: MarC family protein [Victivallaceae bacterium]